MGLVRAVRQNLRKAPDVEQYELSGALAEAEKLADLFDDVKPQPYIVPIERYAGMPLCRQEVKQG